MGQPFSEQSTRAEPRLEDGSAGEEHSNLPLIVFAVSSIAFLVYIALGSIEARIWRFGRLNFEDRTIRHVWSYFGDRLPELPGPSVISGLYWAALAVMVLGTVTGLWLFLGTPDEDPAHDLHASTPDHPAIHE